MVVLLVDGDYLLSGFKPDTDTEVREAVERLEEAMTKQLLLPPSAGSGLQQPPTYQSRIDVRVALFSSALVNSLSSKQRHNVISTLRKLRFQTNVLESVSGRPGSPIDAGLCTKAIMFAMMPGAENVTGGGGGGGPGQVFCFVTPNAYIVSALDLITTRGCEAIFTVYDGDEVAEELLGYVSAAYGTGIATMPKKAGISFIPNTEAASAALAALQQEGKDLPLSVLRELKTMQLSLTARRRSSVRGDSADDSVHAGSGDAQAAILDESRRKVQQEQSLFAPPPPLANVPSPFDDPQPSAPLEEEGSGAPGTPYVYHDDEDDMQPLARVEKPGEKPAPPCSGDGLGAEKFTVTTATSPPDVVQGAVPPTAAPPRSACAYVNAPPAAVSSEPLVATTVPARWGLVYDKNRKRHFFAHRDGGGAARATWEHPLGPVEQRALDDDVQAWYQHELGKLPPSQQQQAASAPTAVDTGAALPTGWEERIDPRSGRKFYINHQTKETTWNPPTGIDAAASPASNGTSPLAKQQQQQPSATGANGRGALPPFWEEKSDPRSGRTYYVNHQTKTTTWTRPAPVAEAVAAPQPLPQQQQQQQDGNGEWEARVDPQGRTFYVNHKLQRTSWTRPSLATSNPSNGGAPALGGGLPPGWEEKVDPRTQRPYYVKHNTKETTWTRPAYMGL